MPGRGGGNEDTRKLKMGWGTGFPKGRVFPSHPTRPAFLHFVQGRLRAEWSQEEPWASAKEWLPGEGCFLPSPETRLQDALLPPLQHPTLLSGIQGVAPPSSPQLQELWFKTWPLEGSAPARPLWCRTSGEPAQLSGWIPGVGVGVGVGSLHSCIFPVWRLIQ